MDFVLLIIINVVFKNSFTVTLDELSKINRGKALPNKIVPYKSLLPEGCKVKTAVRVKCKA